jgi:nicotinamidase-related amidase
MTRAGAAADGQGGLTRDRAIEIAKAGLLVIDVQNYCAVVGQGEHAHIAPGRVPPDLAYYFQRIDEFVLPNIRRMQDAFRRSSVEVLFTVIENLTRDGRDRGLDYKISGIDVPKGSADANVVEAIAPRGDEIVIPKTASSVFNATNIDWVLRNLEIDYLLLAGLLTDQCVESAVRDACDRGFLVTLVEDACGTYSQERHDNTLGAIKGYCRIRTTDEVLTELASLQEAATGRTGGARTTE